MSTIERARGRLPAGTNVGAYQVVRLLAEGGMGRVYEVVDPSIDKPYVIKTLKRDLVGKADAAERMRLEQRALAELDHPNIVQIITAGEHEGSPYLVMEKLAGVTLRQALKRGGIEGDADRDDATDQVPPQRPIPWPVAVAIAIELLEALAVAHSHPLGIVHRDVKPENVFVVDARGRLQVKLVDFGIASLSNSAKQTVGMFRGTPRYSAPEQLRGERVTPATDLYAVGLLLFEMIAGRDPFWGERQLAIGRAHLEKSPPAVRSLVPPASADSFPGALDALIARALAKLPTDRPASATAFADALRIVVRAIPADALAASSNDFLARVRGAETIASATDLLAGLGGPDSQKVVAAPPAKTKKKRAAPFDDLPTELTDAPLMTKAYGEALDAPSAPLPHAPMPWKKSAVAPGAPVSVSANVNISPNGQTSANVRWAAFGAIGVIVVAGLAFAAGRAHQPIGSDAAEAPAEATVATTAVAATGPAAPVAPIALAAENGPAASTAAASSVAAVAETSEPALAKKATPHATHAKAASAAEAPAAAKPIVDVDGVPHVASGL